jgi:hypothetical protein
MDGEKMLLNEVVERLFRGDSVRLLIFRDRAEKEVVVRLNSPWPYLMMARRHDIKPRYVLFSGLVFQPLSNAFIGVTDTRDVNLLFHYYQFLNRELYCEKPEVIVLSRILPDQDNTHSAAFKGAIVESINDTRIRTLEDVAEAFKGEVDYFVIRLEGTGQPIVLDSQTARAAHTRIMQRYGVTEAQSLEDSIVPDQWLKASHQKREKS